MTRMLLTDVMPLLGAYYLAEQRSRSARGRRLGPVLGFREARGLPNRRPAALVVVGNVLLLLVAPADLSGRVGVVNALVVLAVALATGVAAAALHNRTLDRQATDAR